MRSTAFFLAASLAALVAATEPLHKRQTSSPTTSATQPEGTPVRLEDTVNALCQPIYYIWDRGSLDERRRAGLDQYGSYQEIALSLKDSPFPCEKAIYFAAACTTDYIGRDSTGEPYDPSEERNSTSDIIAERACLCPWATGPGSAFFDVEEGCTNCKAVHGYGQDSDYVVYDRRYATWLQERFCNDTVPEKNFYRVVNGPEPEWRLLAPDYPSTAVSDDFPGRTQVGDYYTASSERTGSTSAKGTGSESSTSAEGTGSKSTKSSSAATGQSTTESGHAQTTSGSAPLSTPAPATTSSAASAAASASAAGAAQDLKVGGGGLAMAVLAMAML